MHDAEVARAEAKREEDDLVRLQIIREAEELAEERLRQREKDELNRLNAMREAIELARVTAQHEIEILTEHKKQQELDQQNAEFDIPLSTPNNTISLAIEENSDENNLSVKYSNSGLSLSQNKVKIY